MPGKIDWDWWTEEKCIANVNEWRKQFTVVQEFAVSNDGEKIAAVVEIENKKAVPCVNGKTGKIPMKGYGLSDSLRTAVWYALHCKTMSGLLLSIKFHGKKHMILYGI